MKRRQVAITLFWAGVLLWPALGWGTGPPPLTAGVVPGGRTWSDQGVWFVRLTGEASARGEAAGRLLGPQIRWLAENYSRQLWGAAGPRPELRRTLASWRPFQPPAHLQQLDALARVAGMDPELLLAIHFSPELARGLACSCLGLDQSRSQRGQLLLGRNLDWLGGEVLGHLGLVIIEEVGARHLVSLGWPGLLGVVTGMNSSGLVVANLIAANQHTKPLPGLGVLFAQRLLLEQAEGVAQALPLLQRQRLSFPQSYVLADPHELIAVEAGPGRFELRRPQQGRLVVTNFWGEHTGAPHDGRFARLSQASAQGPLGTPELRLALREVALGKSNLQAAIFEPATLRLEVALGPPPAAQGSWKSFELGAWLRHTSAPTPVR